MKSTSMIACCSLLFAAGSAAAATPRPAASIPGKKPNPARYVRPAGARAPEGGVLYDQTAGANLNNTSQDFEAAFDNFDNQGADDFTVPAATNWSITGAVILGVYNPGNGPM